MKSNLLIRASAGSGKTRKLSLRFLELAAQGVPIPTILASTFTRKATGEILNRILLTAAQACRDDSLREELSRNLGRDVSAEEMMALLRKLIHSLNQIRACSMNGFFNRIALCFPYEIGLKPGWRILDDVEDAHLRWSAIQKTIHQNEKNASTLIRQLFKGESVNRIADEIFEQMKKLLSLEHEAGPDAWEVIQRLPNAGFLNEIEIVQLLTTLENEKNTLSQKNESKRLITAIDKISEALRVNDWFGLAGLTLIRTAFKADGSEPLTYSRKAIDSQNLNDALIRLAHHVKVANIRLLQEQTRSVFTLVEGFARNYAEEKIAANGLQFDDVTRFVADFVAGLGENLQPLYWRMNSSIDHLLLDEFQDTSIDQWHIFRPFGVHCTSGNGKTFFCVGDVKQAIYRWRNGRAEIFDAIEDAFPGIEQENSNISWRSAPEILRCVNRFFLDPMRNSEQDPMVGPESPEPIASEADSVPVRDLLDDLGLDAWNHWNFEKHFASPKSRNYSGYWELRTMPEKLGTAGESSSEFGEDESDSESADAYTPSPEDVQLRWVANEIATLHRKAGAVHRIGVLFRSKRNIAKIARFLRESGVAVSEEGKNPLTNSRAVCLILSLLSLMDFPDSTLNWFHVGNSALAQLFPALSWWDFHLVSGTEAESRSQARTRCLITLRERFQAFGVSSFLEEIADFLRPHCTREEERRLQQLLNLAATYEQTSKMERIADFVTFIRESVLEDPSAASVTLMTIHGSKGLQFDAVVLPDLQFQLAGRSPAFVPGYPNDDVLQDVSLITPVPNQNLRKVLFEPESPFLRAIELNERERISESFSLLYVAMTRAIYAMHIFVPPHLKEQNVPVRFAADLVRIALSAQYSAEPKTLLAWDGDPEWFRKTVKAEKVLRDVESRETSCELSVSETESASEPLEVSEPAQDAPIEFLSSRNSSRNLQRHAPSNVEDPMLVDLGKKLDFSQQNTVNGTIFHGWYEKIAWVENSLPSDEELIALARPFGLSKERLERLLKNFHNSLKSPKLDRVLHWTTYLPMLREKVIRSGILPPERIPVSIFRKDPLDPAEIRWEVYREKELAIRTESALFLGTLDRLILLRNDFQVFWADCIDYKTTRKVSNLEVLEEKIRSHTSQMQDYRRMLQRHYRIADTQISTHLVFSMLGIVREVCEPQSPGEA